MFCSQCGVIIGRNYPQGLYKCPQCENILRVSAFRIIDDKDSSEFVGLESSRRKLCTLFVDEAKIKLLLKQQTSRPDFWLPFMLELEEERLKAFVKRLGWIISSVQKDPGPIGNEEDRPFFQIERDIKDAITNTIVITDFSRITRKALHTLFEMAGAQGIDIIAIAPHRFDENLELSHVDYDIVPGYLLKNHHLDRIWTKPCEERVRELIAKHQWHWTSYAADVVIRELGSETITSWRESDPACEQRHWKEVLTYWIIGYVRRNEIFNDLKLPELKSCTVCKRRFLPSAIPIHLAEIVDFRTSQCRSCLSMAFFFSQRRIDAFIATGPSSKILDMERFIDKFRSMSRKELDHVVKTVLKWREMDKKNPPSHVWLKAFIDAGIVKGYGALASSEMVYRALDGHACMSLGTAMLDNYFHLNGVEHKVEIRYPKHVSHNKSGSLRADFALGDVMVEYAGLWGDNEYKKDLEARYALCQKNRLGMIVVHTEDLICPSILKRKFEGYLGKEENAREAVAEVTKGEQE